MNNEPSLEELRRKIEEVTMEIFRLCGERLRLAKQIVKIKAEENLPVTNVKVEEKLESKILELCEKEAIDKDFGSKLLQVLLEESKRVQHEMLKQKT